MEFEELLKRISPTLRRIAYKLNGHFSSFNDEDLYQEALIHLWQNFTKGKLSDKTDSYILQGSYFHLKNYLRKARIKGNLISLDAIINKGEMSLKETALMEDERSKHYLEYLNSKMLVETIQNNGLTPREKDVLSLCFDGLTTREMGQRIGVSHVRVVKLMAGIRKKCRRYLDKE